MEPSELVVAFANTHADAGGRVERFGSADGVAAWAAETVPDAGPLELLESDVAAVRELRDALVAVLRAHAGDPVLPPGELEDAERRLAAAASRYPLSVVLDRDGVRLQPTQPGSPGLLGRVLAATAELALGGDWHRLRACRNEPCHLAFLDTSRNRSRVFCSPACSSQVAMRAYRKRKRDERPPGVARGGDDTAP